MNEKWSINAVSTFIQNYRELYQDALDGFEERVGGTFGSVLPGVKDIKESVQKLIGALNAVIGEESLPTKQMDHFLKINAEFVNRCGQLLSENSDRVLDLFKEIGHELRKGSANSRMIGDNYLVGLKNAGGDGASVYYQAFQSDSSTMFQTICLELEQSCVDSGSFCVQGGVCVSPLPPQPVPSPIYLESQPLPQPPVEIGQPTPIPNPDPVGSTPFPLPPSAEVAPSNHTSPVVVVPALQTPTSPSTSVPFNQWGDIRYSALVGVCSGTLRAGLYYFMPKWCNLPKSFAHLIVGLAYCGVNFPLLMFFQYYNERATDDPSPFLNALLTAAVQTGQAAAVTLAIEVSVRLYDRFKNSSLSLENSASMSWQRRMWENAPLPSVETVGKFGFFVVAGVFGPGKSVAGKVVGASASVATQVTAERLFGEVERRVKGYLESRDSQEDDAPLVNNDETSEGPVTPNL